MHATRWARRAACRARLTLGLPPPALPAPPAQDRAAFARFTANLRAIAAENAKGRLFLGLNRYSDLSAAEFSARALGLKKRRPTGR